MTAGPVRHRGKDLILDLYVQPRAARDEVAGLHGDRIKVRLAAAPVENKANAALVEFLAGEFGAPKKAVEITAGHSGRRKTVVVYGPRRRPEWLEEAGEE